MNKDGEDQAWDGLAKLLAPVLWFLKLKVWIHNKRHPDDPQEL